MEMLLLGLVAVNIVALVGSKVLKKKSAVTTEGISVDSVQANFNRSRTERFTLIARFIKGRKDASLIERNLTTANLLLKPSEFVAMNLLFLIFIALIAVFILAFKMPNEGTTISLLKRFGFLVFMVYIGWKGPQMILQFIANKRRTTLEYQLADALTIISSALKGGYSFVQGLNMAGEQMEEPIKSEIQRVMRLIQLGLDTPKALVQMSDRVNSYDYDMTISATNIQLAVGGNLSQLLEGISNTIRDRIRLRRDVAALTAQGRISGGILFCLPIGIGVFLCGLNWEYMSYLFTPTGYIFLYVAAGMQACGFFWIKKLLDFDK
jgi:tight adherence protein B